LPKGAGQQYLPGSVTEPSKLCQRLDCLEDVIRHLKPEFLDDIAAFYDPADELEA
jgi:hypothetical protein